MLGEKKGGSEEGRQQKINFCNHGWGKGEIWKWS